MAKFLMSALLALPLLSNAFGSATDLHLSTANCTYNAKDRSLAVEIEVYASNLVELYRANAGELLDMEKGQDQKAAEEFLTDYLQLNFLFIQDGKLLQQNFLKIKVVDEKVYMLLDIELLRTGDLMLKNMLFFETFVDQINIVKVYSGGNSSDYYFNSNTPEQAIII